MTLIMLYKKNESSFPVMAGDRATVSSLPLPMMKSNKLSCNPKYKKTFHYRKDSPKCRLNNGVLIGGAGDKPLVNFVLNDIQFPKPYLEEGSYNHYVSSVFIDVLMEKVDAIYFMKNKKASASFLFSIGLQTYTLRLVYPEYDYYGWEVVESDKTIKILYDRYNGVVVEYYKNNNLLGVGDAKALNEMFKYTKELGSKIYSMTAEEIVTGVYKRAANSTKNVGFGLDIMHG